MLKVLRRDTPGLVEVPVVPGWGLPADTIWVDLECPTREEELAVEQALRVELPTREEMADIEPSSRLYQEGGSTFMTATLLSRAGGARPAEAPVTFVLTNGTLVTIRYVPIRAFTVFAARTEQAPLVPSGVEALFGLLDAVIERLAGILEDTALKVEESSVAIFEHEASESFRPLLTALAFSQSLAAKTRTSLASLARVVSFVALAGEIENDKDCKAHLKALQRDVQTLTEHAGYLSGNVAFLLDAALGLINIQQNGIIKFFSVVAVVFLPPTLCASIWGMNFHHMPELSWTFGYPLALVAIVCSGILPYWWFRRRGML
ncbi:magnesium transporter CorA family protein [Phenylobacterium sp.]|jgi:magnesium transporter|uniref:magnesium transporter CorA family protein n=1 Tax=Phenylobacterium sp. TaxID=1871053 RepID=UPI002F3FDC32